MQNEHTIRSFRDVIVPVDWEHYDATESVLRLWCFASTAEGIMTGAAYAVCVWYWWRRAYARDPRRRRMLLVLNGARDEAQSKHSV